MSGNQLTAENLEKKNKFIKMIEGIKPKAYDYTRTFAFGGSEEVLNAEIIQYVLDDIRLNPGCINDALSKKSGFYKKRNENSTDNTNARAYSIVCDENGELALYIEPKSKSLLGIKQRSSIPLPAGTDKTLKVAFKVGATSLEAQAALVVKFNDTAEKNAEKKQRMQREQEIARKFKGCKGFCQTVSVEHGDKLTMYSPFQPDGTLEELMSSKKQTLTDDERIDISRQILEILVELSNKRISHHDIKPANFLVKFNEKSGRPEISLIDFGFSLNFGEEETARFTPKFVNPWKLAHVYPREPVKDLLKDQAVHDPLKGSVYEGHFLRSVKKAGSEHDIFAAGKIIHELFENKYADAVYEQDKSSDVFLELLKKMHGPMSLRISPLNLLNEFNTFFPRTDPKAPKKRVRL